MSNGFTAEVRSGDKSDAWYHQLMVRIREITDPDLRARVLEALAGVRGCSIAAIPDWFELDDADFVDLLNLLKEEDMGDGPDDPRM